MDNAIPLHQEWSKSRKRSFRFIFILSLLFIIPFPLTTIFGIFNWNVVPIAISNFWVWISEGIALNIIGLEEIPPGSPGSGDKTLDWVQYALFILLSGVGTVVWSILDKARVNYYKLWRIFVLILTYYVASIMFSYGFSKVFRLQMSEPSISRLLMTYGQSSPMGLAWTFIGASGTYTVYSGLSEVIAGLLLIFRRTRTLGGLVTFGVMFNVFVLNLAYDIPVKLFSCQLMLMGLYLALIDRKALIALLWRKGSGTAVPWPNFFSKSRNNYILLGVQILFIGYTIISLIDGDLSNRKRFGVEREKSALYGLYDVEHFIQNGDTIPPLMTDDTRWQRVIFDYTTFTQLLYMDDRSGGFSSVIDTTAQTLTLSRGRDSLRVEFPFTYERLEDGLMLRGVMNDDTLVMKLKSQDLSNFYLTNRGFNWVNEVPWHRYNPTPKPNW